MPPRDAKPGEIIYKRRYPCYGYGIVVEEKAMIEVMEESNRALRRMEGKSMKVLGFGEIVWDEIPQLPVSPAAGPAHNESKEMILGGAVLNVMAHLHRLGAETHILTAIGNDDLGGETLKAVEKTGVRTDLLRVVDAPTCVVRVKFSPQGQPSYVFEEDVSWDHLDITSADIDMIQRQDFDVFCFGTLHQRKQASLKSLDRLLEQVPFDVVFVDINLRTPFYCREIIEYSLQKCNIAKMNTEEAAIIAEIVHLPFTDITEFMAQLRQTFDIEKICITDGAQGVHYSGPQDSGFTSGYQVTVADTVGAGDAFSAGLLYRLSNGDSLAQACDFGCKTGALIASKKGAISDWDIAELAALQKNG